MNGFNSSLVPKFKFENSLIFGNDHDNNNKDNDKNIPKTAFSNIQINNKLKSNEDSKRRINSSNVLTGGLNRQQTKRPISNIKKLPDFINVIEILKKKKLQRTRKELKSITPFLCQAFNFFKKINEESLNEKLDSFIATMNLEIFEIGDKIVNYGEEGQKIYFILQGEADVCKPILLEKQLTLKEFTLYLNNIKFFEKDELKLNRLLQANSKLIDIVQLKFINYDSNKLREDKYKTAESKIYFIEEQTKISIKKEGDEFGEISFLQRAKRTVCIIAKKQCIIANIEKNDFNIITRRLEEKKFHLIIDEFRKGYRLTRNWNKPPIIKLMESFTKVHLNCGDFVYEQNTKSDDIYFIINGSFEFISHISISTCKVFEEYITYSKSNILNYLKNNGKLPLDELNKLKNKMNINILKDFPLHATRNLLKFKVKPLKENLIDMKFREDELKEGTEIFPVKFRSLNYRDILGLEEACEFKKRYYSIKCISPRAELYKLKFDEFIDLLNDFDIRISDILNCINERKDLLCKQLRRCEIVRRKNKQLLIQQDLKTYVDNENEKEGIEKNKLTKGLKIINSELTKPKPLAKKPSQKKKVVFSLNSMVGGSYLNEFILKIKNEDVSPTNNDEEIDTESQIKLSEVINLRSISTPKTESNTFNVKNLKSFNSTSINYKSSIVFDEPINNLKSFNIKNYRLQLESKNFEQITDEISKVAGSSVVNSVKLSKNIFSKVFDKKLISINPLTNFDEKRKEAMSTKDSNINKFIERNNKTPDSKFRSIMNLNLDDLKSKESITHFENMKLKRILNISGKSSQQSFNFKSPKKIEDKERYHSNDNIPMAIKMKNFMTLRNKKNKKSLLRISSIF